MIICPKCKAEIELNSLYCDQCGFELRFCSQCGKPGKGNRCTFCGGIMYIPAEKSQNTVAGEESTVRVDTVTTNNVKGFSVPQLLLTNTSLNVRLEGENGAIIGRRKGPYQLMMANFSYISGSHAQLKYDALSGWTITDMNSTNGTLLNQNRLMPGVPTVLQNGEKLQLANIELNIEIRP